LSQASCTAAAAAANQDPYEALQLALDPTNIHPIDVALVNGEVFANLATAGAPPWHCGTPRAMTRRQYRIVESVIMVPPAGLKPCSTHMPAVRSPTALSSRAVFDFFSFQHPQGKRGVGFHVGHAVYQWVITLVIKQGVDLRRDVQRMMPTQWRAGNWDQPAIWQQIAKGNPN
jgi:hypothetical protein